MVIIPILPILAIGLVALAARSPSKNDGSTRVSGGTARDLFWGALAGFTKARTGGDLSTRSFYEVWSGLDALINAGGIEWFLRDQGRCAYMDTIAAHRDDCLVLALAILRAMNMALGLPETNGWMSFEQFRRWMGLAPLSTPTILLARRPPPEGILVARPPKIPFGPPSSRFASAEPLPFHIARR